MHSSNDTIGKLKLFGHLRDNEARVRFDNLHYLIAAWTLEEWEQLEHRPDNAIRVGNVMVQLTAE